MNTFDYDFIVIGSGFGGSVSALRLAEKGYKVLVIEKGKRFSSNDFAKTNWNLKRWLWLPLLRFWGIFKITFFKHVAILSGVGVGGGSLVYANTLPIPKDDFFSNPSWSHLTDWKTELMPFYETSEKMLGAVKNPRFDLGDKILQSIARDFNKEEEFETTKVAVYFGEPGKTVPDPYFGGEGPDRTGCNFCGACMVGCRYNSKNTLDKNYLYFAEKLGAKILAEKEVISVIPLDKANGSSGYEVVWKESTKIFPRKGSIRTKGVVFAGGVLGTLPLLLKLKETTLPNLSDKLGKNVRTNSESLLGVTAPGKDKVFSEGVAISSIFHVDEHSHVEPVRYPSGSGFWRLLVYPLVEGNNVFVRLAKTLFKMIRHPVQSSKLYLVKDWAKHTQILLFMQTIDSTLSFKKGKIRKMKTSLSTGKAPTAFMPEARDLARRFAEKADGTPGALLTETLLGIPTTAHILGGCVMGKDAGEGVIDKNNRIFNYENMFICDGSMISANPGVNPSLTITALTERAMSKISPKADKVSAAER